MRLTVRCNNDHEWQPHPNSAHAYAFQCPTCEEWGGVIKWQPTVNDEDVGDASTSEEIARKRAEKAAEKHGGEPGVYDYNAGGPIM